MDRKQLLWVFVPKRWLLLFLVLYSTSCMSKVGATASKDILHAQRRKLATDQNSSFLSIDCGANADYVDEVTGIVYKSDRGFASSGRNQDISPGYDVDNIYYAQQLKTLRLFPEGSKICYTLQPQQGRNHNYYIRVSFHYGNYDGKNQVPRFDLYIGVNYWVTVQFADASTPSFYGIVYFSLTDTIDVCLVNTGSGIPFISALEVRLLNDYMYRIESGSLKPLLSCDIGGYPLDKNVRYKDDAYDRIWKNCFFSGYVTIDTTADIDNQSGNDSYRVPVEVLRTAIQPRNGSSLSYTYGRSNSTRDLYIYFHFAEIVSLKQDQRREFSINLNGVNYGPYTLEYSKTLTLRPQKLPIQGEIRFSINSTVQSDLPPILNAFEIFFVQPPGLSPTSTADVTAIMAIKQMYDIERVDWQGDPCLPAIAAWSGLNCSSENTSRIIYLNLSSSNLKGEIAPSISNLTAIRFLDLSNNKLTGTVPDFLGEMPNLTVLNLNGNRLTGVIPQSIVDKANRGLLQLSFDGNPNLCHKDSCYRKKQSINVPVIASLVPISVLFLIITAVIWKLRRRRVTTTKESLLKSKDQSIKYSEIVRITKDFKNIIGEGGFGKVYLGELKDGTRVAVKMLSDSSKQGYKEFRAEVQLLMIVHHKNLVSLIGYCDDHEKLALVYEYMASGNLHQHLSGTKTDVLNWRERLQIAVNAALGLEYLHNGCKPPIIHRDLKPSNILLTENLQGKISDFGLSKVFGTEIASHITTRPAGTFGYLDPEFQRTGNLSKKSDVYSFGILLFELITGKPAIIVRREENNHIIEWVVPLIEEGDIGSIVDPRLQGEFSIESAWKALEIAKSCVPSTAIERPDTSQVLAELKECLAMDIASRSVRKTKSTMPDLCHSVDVCLEFETNMVPSPR